MEMLEVVIRIPKDMYDRTLCTGVVIVGIDAAYIGGAIIDGTVLPKGHGRLIDADAINIHDVSPTYGMEVYGVTQDDIEYEPTVIGADREVQDES